MGFHNGHPLLDNLLCGPVHLCIPFPALRGSDHQYVPTLFDFRYNLRHDPHIIHMHPKRRQLCILKLTD